MLFKFEDFHLCCYRDMWFLSYKSIFFHTADDDKFILTKLHIIFCKSLGVMKSQCFYTPRKQSLGGYIGFTLSVRQFVRPSMYLVSATPPKPLIGFL